MTMSASKNETVAPNVLVVLLDSLNRHMLGAYGGAEFETPNLDRFAKESVVFDKHVTGSLPCMPARHDILCGALDFLWKPWGSIEIWEESLTASIRRSGGTTNLVTDHPHLFETGGENYHTDFHAWNYLRGHEGDPWKTSKDPSWIGEPAMPAHDGGWFWERTFGFEGPERPYDTSRTYFREEADYPGPKTMAETARWLTDSAPTHDRWFCFVDEFDPHEPFDTPSPWFGMYEDRTDKSRASADALIWPPYADGCVTEGHMTESEGRQIRANYGSKLSMIDHWFGRVLDALDDNGHWKNTVVMVCTDHGHYLGDYREGRDIWGKPAVPQFEPLGHIPLMIRWPGVDPKRVSALTTNVDIHATIADIFDVEAGHVTHGNSLKPLVDGTAQSIREWAIGGVYGSWVQITNGRHKYARASVGDGFPLSMWSNRWSTMPIDIAGIEMLPKPDSRASLDMMPNSEVPVIRQPFRAGDMVPMWASSASIVGQHHLYDLDRDPNEGENLVGEPPETELIEALRTELHAVDAPADQFERLGIA